MKFIHEIRDNEVTRKIYLSEQGTGYSMFMRLESEDIGILWYHATFKALDRSIANELENHRK